MVLHCNLKNWQLCVFPLSGFGFFGSTKNICSRKPWFIIPQFSYIPQGSASRGDEKCCCRLAAAAWLFEFQAQVLWVTDCDYHMLRRIACECQWWRGQKQSICKATSLWWTLRVINISVPQFPKINSICHSFCMTDDYWDSWAPAAINQTAGPEERASEGDKRWK